MVASLLCDIGGLILNQLVSDNDNCSSQNNLNECAVHVKLLCGADLLESFDVPGLWEPADVSYWTCLAGRSLLM